ncbi:MAG TPA: thiamine pyrophosphate-dependent enzyme [Bryobacteraceae bacterium]|nr:thiamine pyrophosphate-dependent enzyme [Bryobacteraceae bacterium]
MQHLIILPDLGQTTSEAKVLKWLKQPGDPIRRGEPLLTVETDKVDMDVESFADGFLRGILVPEGSVVAALAPLAVVTATLQESWMPPAPATEQPAPEPIVSREKPAGREVPAAPELPREPAPAHEFRARPLTPEQQLAMFRRMLLCRQFEDRVYYLFLQGRMPGTIHQAQGQEACAVGVCAALGPGDMITSTHRPHEHAVARGIPVRSLMAELFARSTGCCRGKGGSMHIGDVSLGMLPAVAIVGGGIPLAAGFALAFQYLKTGNIVACFFGDGATNIGPFHEAVNVAAIWNLPVVFVCENNKYGASTAIEKVTRVPHVSDRAGAYGIPGRRVDGNDLEAVYAAMLEAAAAARAGAGPTLLELETYRFAGHSRSDPGHYRPKEEVEQWKLRDPIERYQRFLIEQGLLSPEQAAEMRNEVERELDEAVAFAEGSPQPAPEDCLTDVFA